MELVEIAVMQNDSEALVLKSVLESAGIEAMYHSNLVQSVHPITVNGIGKVRILVRPEDEARAREILDSREELPGGIAE
ncbi:MAG: DUF2007 domain-containing protein [Candidatus Eisenbacteria bacterium]